MFELSSSVIPVEQVEPHDRVATIAIREVLQFRSHHGKQ